MKESCEEIKKEGGGGRPLAEMREREKRGRRRGKGCVEGGARRRRG